MKTADESTVPIHEGGCLCGAVRYRAVGSPEFVAVCHCKNCQRNSGSAFSVNCAFRKDAVTIQGTLSVYEDKGDTGDVVRRLFCGKCGTPIESQSTFSASHYTVLKAGTFDEPRVFTPDTEVYCASAFPWLTDGAERPRYQRLK